MKMIMLMLLLLSAVPVCSAQKAAVVNIRENVLYMGIENPLYTIASPYSCNDITLIADNGRIERTGPCHYNILLDSGAPHIVSIQVLYRGKQGSMVVGKFLFRAKNLPSPVPMLGGKTSGSIQAAALKVQLGVAAVLYGFDIEARYVVTAFRLTLIRKSGACTTLTARGAYFTPEMKALLKTVEPADIVLCSGITADGPGQKGVALAPLELTVE